MAETAIRTTNVLLVEDDRDDFLLTQDILQRIETQRYRLTWVGTYESARQELRERSFDVALVDYRIGERTGLDFIRDVGPFHPGCPMILLTGLRDPDIDIAAQQAGAADYLVKDSLSEELLDRTIRYACQQAQRSALQNSLLTNATAGMIALDGAGRPLVWNGRALAALGISDALTAPQTLERLGAAIAALTQSGRMPEEIEAAGGLSYELKVSAVPGGGRVLVLHDVTHRKQAEKLLRQSVADAEAASRAKSSFLATISHELRTPLNGILGMVRVLESTPLDETQLGYLETVKSSGQSLLGIINDVLDLSKIEAGHMEIEQVEFEPATVIDEVLRLLAPNAFANGVELAGFIDPALPQVVVGDPLRLRQVVTNLLSNAIKFTPSGSITVWAAKDPDARGTALRVDVVDTGIGIPAGRVGDLFQPFAQLDASTTRKYGGTGLGLAICRQLVSLMDGRIWVESVEGRGSTFSFSLPLAAKHGERAPAVRADAAALKDAGLLLVSPAAELGYVIEAYAQTRGARMTQLADGAGAAEALRSCHTCAVIVDAALPAGEIDKVRRAAAACGAAVVPPVVVLAAHGTAEAEGAGLLHRPFVRSTFERLCQQIVAAARGTRPAAAGPVSGAQPRRLRVLVVEDNIANQRVTSALLRSAGCEVEIAADGRKGVELGATGRFDVILMDLDMPVMDGVEATRRLRAIDTIRHVPIIALTAKILREDRDRCLEAGMSDYLTKPVDWDKLVGLLKALERDIYGERLAAS